MPWNFPSFLMLSTVPLLFWHYQKKTTSITAITARIQELMKLQVPNNIQYWQHHLLIITKLSILAHSLERILQTDHKYRFTSITTNKHCPTAQTPLSLTSHNPLYKDHTILPTSLFTLILTPYTKATSNHFTDIWTSQVTHTAVTSQLPIRDNTAKLSKG